MTYGLEMANFALSENFRGYWWVQPAIYSGPGRTEMPVQPTSGDSSGDTRQETGVRTLQSVSV